MLIVLSLAQLLIADIGWRDAFRIIGLICFLLVGPANLHWQRRPPIEQAVSSITPEHPTEALALSESAADKSPRLRQILRHPTIWLLLLTVVC
jgi:hypothetical protein